MIDVVISGAGPAGAVAAIVLARAGARVMLLDRATFPREKLCGDTVNPGTLALLRRLGLAAIVESRGLPVSGMLVTGEHGVAIEGRYPRGLSGRAIVRAELDLALVRDAIEAGVVFEPGTAVRSALVRDRGGRSIVGGVTVSRGAGAAVHDIDAPITLAADGRHSVLAFSLGLARHPASPRRWAAGAYFEGVHARDASTAVGEMHIRRGQYIGVAPLPDGRTNVCLVKPSAGGDRAFADPAAALNAAIAGEPILADRFRRATMIAPPVVLGPLAVESTGDAIEGLLTAGDASGFVDPMTGDGLRFAIRGGELAAETALRVLEHGWTGAHAALQDARRREFSGKWRFNRALRSLVSSPAAVAAAAAAAPFAPAVVRSIVARAGDCHRAD